MAMDITQKHLASQTAEIMDLKSQLATATAKAEEGSLSATTALDRVLGDERERAALERQSLIVQLTALINTTANDQETRLAQRVALVKGDMANSQQDLSQASVQFAGKLTSMSTADDKFLADLATSREKLKTTLQADWKKAEDFSTNLQGTTQAIHSQTVSLVDEQIKEVDVQMRTLDEFVTKARAQNDEHHKRFNNTFGALKETARTSYDTIASSIQEMRDDVEEFETDFNSQTQHVKSSFGPFVETTQLPLQRLRKDLANTRLIAYAPVGETPRRRKYDYPNKLPKTEKHEDVIRKMKASKASRSRFGYHEATKRSSTGTIESSPLSSDVEMVIGDMDNAAVEKDGDKNIDEVNNRPLFPTLYTTTTVPSDVSPHDESSASKNPARPTNTDEDAPAIVPPPTAFTFTGPNYSTGDPFVDAAGLGARLKELNPNMEVGVFRGVEAVVGPAAGTTKIGRPAGAKVAVKDPGSSLAGQPPLKKQAVDKVEKIVRRRTRGQTKTERGAENMPTPGRRRG